MKLKLKTEEFSNLLATVLPAVSIRSTLPTLSHFLIDAKDGKVSVYATDLEIGIESSISTDIEKEGSVTVPARNLTEMVRVLDSEEFTFQKVSDSQFKIFTSDGNTTFNIIGGEKEEFPVLPKIKREKSVELESCKIKEGIEKMKSEAAILGGEAITDIQSDATGLWKRLPAQRTIGNAYVRANFTASVVVSRK